MTVIVRFSKEEELIVPESLGQVLGLREGDRVEVQRQDNVLWFQRRDKVHSPGPLTDLARIVSSSRQTGSVDVERFMDRHGYEQVYGSWRR
jgi:hypothetical protein